MLDGPQLQFSLPLPSLPFTESRQLWLLNVVILTPHFKTLLIFLFSSRKSCHSVRDGIYNKENVGIEI